MWRLRNGRQKIRRRASAADFGPHRRIICGDACVIARGVPNAERKPLPPVCGRMPAQRASGNAGAARPSAARRPHLVRDRRSDRRVRGRDRSRVNRGSNASSCPARNVGWAKARSAAPTRTTSCLLNDGGHAPSPLSPPYCRCENAVSALVMNSSRQARPSSVCRRARWKAPAISPGSSTRSLQPPSSRANAA